MFFGDFEEKWKKYFTYRRRKYCEKWFTFSWNVCIIEERISGGAPDSIAGERKDKHTADGVAASKTFRLNLNANNNAKYALAA